MKTIVQRWVERRAQYKEEDVSRMQGLLPGGAPVVREPYPGFQNDLQEIIDVAEMRMEDAEEYANAVIEEEEREEVESVVSMLTQEANDLRGIIQLINKGMYKDAGQKAEDLDTAVREEIPADLLDFLVSNSDRRTRR